MLSQGLGAPKTSASNNYEEIFGADGAKLARQIAPGGVASIDAIERARGNSDPEAIQARLEKALPALRITPDLQASAIEED